MENVSISNNKGQQLSANMYPSKTATHKLAILCPGYLDTKDYVHLVRLAEQLTGRGYTVASFDPTGTWGSEGSNEEYLTSQYLEDIKSVLEYMLSQAPYSSILLGGHSRGGQVAILYAAHDPRVTQILAIMPSHGPVEGSRREEWEKEGFKDSDRDIPGSTDRKYFHIPFKHVLDRDQFDALGDIKKIKASIILIAGELDDLVTPEEVRQLYDAANQPKKYMILEGIGHDYRLNSKEVERVNIAILKEI